MCKLNIIDADCLSERKLKAVAQPMLKRGEKVFVCANKETATSTKLTTEYPHLFYFLLAPKIKDGADVYILLELKEVVGKSQISEINFLSAPDTTQREHMNVAAHYFGAKLTWSATNELFMVRDNTEPKAPVKQKAVKAKTLPTKPSKALKKPLEKPTDAQNSIRYTLLTKEGFKDVSKNGKIILGLFTMNKSHSFQWLVENYRKAAPKKFSKIESYKASATKILTSLQQQGFIGQLAPKVEQQSKSTYRFFGVDSRLTPKESFVASIIKANSKSLNFDSLLQLYMKKSDASATERDSFKHSLTSILANLTKKGVVNHFEPRLIH